MARCKIAKLPSSVLRLRLLHRKWTAVFEMNTSENVGHFDVQPEYCICFHEEATFTCFYAYLQSKASKIK